MKFLYSLIVILLLELAGILVFVYSGLYEIGADAPHTEPVFKGLELFRDRSIQTRAQQLEVPELEIPARIADGAIHYAAMCSGCHLAPGKHNTEIRQGLYPTPPDFSSETDLSPAEQFWVIKHGIKMTAMPAWGHTHSDEEIWSLVAFLRTLPSLSTDQYAALTSGADHQHDHGAMDHAQPQDEAASMDHGHVHEHPHDDGSTMDHEHAHDAGATMDHQHAHDAGGKTESAHVHDHGDHQH